MEENKHPQGHHETSDVDTWAAGKFGIALALTCILSLAMLFGLFRYFQVGYGALPQRGSVEFDPAKVFPQPQLQTSPSLDLRAIRAAEEEALNSYGWVDKQNGVVRMPIERAMELLAQRGLPSRKSAPPQTGVSIPTESGLGTKQ